MQAVGRFSILDLRRLLIDGDSRFSTETSFLDRLRPALLHPCLLVAQMLAEAPFKFGHGLEQNQCGGLIEQQFNVLALGPMAAESAICAVAIALKWGDLLSDDFNTSSVVGADTTVVRIRLQDHISKQSGSG